MTISVKHAKTLSIPDGPDTSVARPSDWNADHQLVGVGTMAEQNATAVAITGGAIDGVVIGGSTKAAGSFTTLTATGTTSLGGVSGIESLRVSPIASGVNYAKAYGAITSNTPTYAVDGADTNVALNVNSKGTGGIGLFTGGGKQAVIASTTSAVNYLQVTGAATGGGPIQTAQGTDSNIPFQVTSKGTSSIFAVTGGGTQFAIANTASAVNYWQLTGSATTVRPLAQAAGSDANIGINFSAKGASGVLFTGNGASVTLANISGSTTAVNYLQIGPADTGSAPSVSAQGSDANIDLALTPKGTGNIKFGTWTINADAAINGYITIKDAAGTTRKLATIA